eukprot:m.345913 g.345913  ORF g.345913 m.345913 type:complete len:119 (-) comp27555_c0_seq1:697-1053(-)
MPSLTQKPLNLACCLQEFATMSSFNILPKFGLANWVKATAEKKPVMLLSFLLVFLTIPCKQICPSLKRFQFKKSTEDATHCWRVLANLSLVLFGCFSDDQPEWKNEDLRQRFAKFKKV